MTVRELIKSLEKLNPDAEVYAMEATTGCWQLVEDAGECCYNTVTLGCKEVSFE